MQLRHLAIPHFRNLRDVVIDFATQLSPMPGAAADAVPKAIRSHALIGQNGTGKSNLIEALITIFRDVDLDRDAALDYTLEYEIRGHTVLGAHNGFTAPGLAPGRMDFSDIAADATRAAFWIVSDMARRLYLYAPGEDRVLHSAPLTHVRKGTVREVAKPEGVDIDPAAGRLYVASDSEAQLYVFDVRA